ncbi:hypothetical protein FHT03_002770 [Xanthomonas arboricola]
MPFDIVRHGIVMVWPRALDRLGKLPAALAVRGPVASIVVQRGSAAGPTPDARRGYGNASVRWIVGARCTDEPERAKRLARSW